jgi:hypothetical protein
MHSHWHHCKFTNTLLLLLLLLSQHGAAAAAAAATTLCCHAPAGFSLFAALAVLLGLEPFGKKFLKPACRKQAKGKHKANTSKTTGCMEEVLEACL